MSDTDTANGERFAVIDAGTGSILHPNDLYMVDLSRPDDDTRVRVDLSATRTALRREVKDTAVAVTAGATQRTGFSTSPMEYIMKIGARLADDPELNDLGLITATLGETMEALQEFDEIKRRDPRIVWNTTITLLNEALRSDDNKVRSRADMDWTYLSDISETLWRSYLQAVDDTTLVERLRAKSTPNSIVWDIERWIIGRRGDDIAAVVTGIIINNPEEVTDIIINNPEDRV